MPKDIYGQILDLWSDMTDGIWSYGYNGDVDYVKLETPEDTYKYGTLKEAALDALYTINEIIKEA